MNDEQIIKDFIEGTPAWIKSLDRQAKISGIKMCPMCGIQPEKIHELANALKQHRTAPQWKGRLDEWYEGTISLPRKPVVIGLWLVVIGLLIANVIIYGK